MIATPTIRLAVRADLPALHALIERAYRGDEARRGWTHEADLLDGQRTDLAALDEALANPGQHLLIAEANGAILGCVQITDKDDGLAYLGLLTVDPRRQAGGLGKVLIAAAEREAATLFGVRIMEITVIRQRTELIDYYLRRGYRLTGEERPFPLDNPRFGLPRRRDLAFTVLAKDLPDPGQA